MKLLAQQGCTVHHANCLDVLRGLPDDSIDSVVTDAPYGLGKPPPIQEVLERWLAGKPYQPKGSGFMGETWDAFVPGPEVWKECFRVLKPGAHMVVFAGTRTQDVMGLAIRLAGFEIRDCLQYLYGSGMPHSLNISKAIDAAAGAEREVVGTRMLTGNAAITTKEKGGTFASNTDTRGVAAKEVPITAPATDEAKEWDGYGTNLKPSVEPIILARKPLEGTVVANVLEHGTGGLNIDGCRLETSDDLGGGRLSGATPVGKGWDRPWMHDESRRVKDAAACAEKVAHAQAIGRWPANVMLDEEAAAILDAEVGNRPGMSGGGKHKTHKPTIAGGGHDGNEFHLRGDSGGPSRFFYTSKVGKGERHEGCHYLPRTKNARKRWRQDTAGTWEPRAQNTHPTVKGIELMLWLCRLVTPKNGTVLDIFMGSGSTGCAAVLEGFSFIGCDLGGRSAHTAAARIRHFLEVKSGAPRRRKPPVRRKQTAQLSLLGAIDG